jgi:hypothetical protein
VKIYHSIDPEEEGIVFYKIVADAYEWSLINILLESIMKQQDMSLLALEGFFNQWSTLGIREIKYPVARIDLQTESLVSFLADMSQPFTAVAHPSLYFDPWEIAGLRRNEVRNSAVLAWLLDPAGSHGFGSRPLVALLHYISRWRDLPFPLSAGKYCRVEVETHPTGDETNRVDIAIDAQKFFLLIEVKIDAAEQENQLARYCEEAKVRAAGREKAVVFLTPQGRDPLTRGDVFTRHDVPCISWRQLAGVIGSALDDILRNLQTCADTSPSRQMAAWSVLCFLERMRQF